jgi:hypothetical protein
VPTPTVVDDRDPLAAAEEALRTPVGVLDCATRVSCRVSGARRAIVSAPRSPRRDGLRARQCRRADSRLRGERARSGRGARDEALTLFQQAYDDSPSWVILYNIGKMAALTGDGGGAARVRVPPESGTARSTRNGAEVCNRSRPAREGGDARHRGGRRGSTSRRWHRRRHDPASDPVRGTASTREAEA